MAIQTVIPACPPVQQDRDFLMHIPGNVVDIDIPG
jgi:hypothetical protein